jgi:peptidoglycan/LPS O-acetylase OafA/YrhL
LSSTSINDRATYLDGIRGWAAFAVLVYHASWNMFGGVLPALQATWLGLLNDGQMAVSIFFVLSGFVLSIGYFRKGGLDPILKLAVQRYPRLTIPIAMAALIAYILMSSGLLYNH